MAKKFRLTVDFKAVSITTTAVGLLLIYLNFTYLSRDSQLFTILNLITAVIMLGVPLLYRYQNFSKTKELETAFPRFLRDITANINTGMSLPQALRVVSDNEYGALTTHVRELSAKISWGIPFEQAFRDFAGKAGSRNIKRTVQTIIEAHRAGGTMNTVLDSVADSLSEIEKIKQERSASVYSQMVNGYMIFFIFLVVMVGISSFMVPTLQFEVAPGGADLSKLFPQLFRSLVLIQGFFAGIAIGKMSEGTITAGIKHALVMSIIGYSAFVLFG